MHYYLHIPEIPDYCLLSFTPLSDIDVTPEIAPLCLKGFINIQVVIMREIITTRFAYETTQACSNLIIYAVLHIFTYHEC